MVRYRTPSLADAAALAELGRVSFVDAFGHLYRAADLDAFLRATYTPQAIETEMANANRLYQVAQDGNDLVGYCKLGLDLSLDFDPGTRRPMELKQLYLLGKRTGGGVGAGLMDWALSEARARGFDAVILSVWSGNHRGQNFYRRYGFEKWGDTVFLVGEQRDEEYIFGLDL